MTSVYTNFCDYTSRLIRFADAEKWNSIDITKPVQTVSYKIALEIIKFFVLNFSQWNKLERQIDLWFHSGIVQ